VERQIDAGRAECRTHYAQASTSGNKPNLASHRHHESSQEEEESDSDFDLGGPEGSVPPPDNDESLGGIITESPMREESPDDPDRDDFVLQRRRVASAPVSPSLARHRRRQIASSLGITADHGKPSWNNSAPSTTARRIQDTLPNIDGQDSIESRLQSADPWKNRHGTGRRRLSTGQLWLGRYNRAASLDTAFGSGVSGDEDAPSADEQVSEKSFEKHL
jgi:hypothetical protein